MLGSWKSEKELAEWLGPDAGTEHSKVPVQILHGMNKVINTDDLGDYTRVTFTNCMVDDAYGQMHTKICLVFFGNGVRLSILTGKFYYV